MSGCKWAAAKPQPLRLATWLLYVVLAVSPFQERIEEEEEEQQQQQQEEEEAELEFGQTPRRAAAAERGGVAGFRAAPFIK